MILNKKVKKLRVINELLISNYINMILCSLNRIVFDKKREYLKVVCKLLGIFVLRFFGEGVGGGVL